MPFARSGLRCGHDRGQRCRGMVRAGIGLSGEQKGWSGVLDCSKLTITTFCRIVRVTLVLAVCLTRTLHLVQSHCAQIRACWKDPVAPADACARLASVERIGHGKGRNGPCRVSGNYGKSTKLKPCSRYSVRLLLIP